MISSDMWKRLEKRDFNHPHNGAIGGVAKAAPARVQIACDLRRAGKSYEEIAKEMGISPSSVSGYLKKGGVQRTNRPRDMR